MTLKVLWIFVLAIALAFTLFAAISALGGNYGIGEKAAYLIALAVGFIWLLPRLFNLFTDIMVPRTFRGRKIFIDQKFGGYNMQKVVYSLNSYFAEHDAIIADGSGTAEFIITLKPFMMDPAAINCQLNDQHGYEITLKEYGHYWPGSLALAVSQFIRTSDSRPVSK